MLDEAHLLGKETLEEFRFLLNYRYDSSSPMSLILVGQTELWEQKLRLQSYAAIRQRIDMNIVLNRLDRAETSKYIAAHMAYAGVKQDLFTSGAEEEVFKVSAGIPRMINRICEKTLMYAYQQQKRLIDEHMVRFVADHEMVTEDLTKFGGEGETAFCVKAVLIFSCHGLSPFLLLSWVIGTFRSTLHHFMPQL